MIQTVRRSYTLLARWLDYPDEGHAARLREALPELERWSPVAGAKLAGFLARVEVGGATALEELFTRTFDINPACTLELGWILYGQDYARGAFLVKMRRLLAEHGIQESGELPDHLTHVLRLLDRFTSEAAAAFVAAEVLPGISKMREGFQDAENPYAEVIEAVWIVLRERFTLPVDAEAEPVP